MPTPSPQNQAKAAQLLVDFLLRRFSPFEMLQLVRYGPQGGTLVRQLPSYQAVAPAQFAQLVVNLWMQSNLVNPELCERFHQERPHCREEIDRLCRELSELLEWNGNGDDPLRPHQIACAVKDPSGTLLGTAFFAGPTTVITAFHVVRSRADSQTLDLDTAFELFHRGRSVGTARAEAGDANLDWAMLRARTPWEGPLPASAGSFEHDTEVWIFGFPELNPHDGKTFTARVLNTDARYREQPAVELSSPEAGEAPVRGLSGSPCLRDGALLGLVRSGLLDPRTGEGKGQSLYACPLDHLPRYIFDRVGDGGD